MSAAVGGAEVAVLLISGQSSSEELLVAGASVVVVVFLGAKLDAPGISSATKEGARAETGATLSSRALGRAFEAAGHTRPAGSAAHHIVAGGAQRAAPARAALDRFGIGIDDAANGVFLPANVHSRIHTNAYYDAVNSALSQATTREEAIQALNVIGQRLANNGGF